MEQSPQNFAPHRVEAYLDQMLAPLARRLSAFHRDELRRELRTHLWARIEAYCELGQSEDDAVTEALRQFGGAEDFLRQWQREWRSIKPSVTLRTLYEVGKSAVMPSLTGIISANLLYLVVQEYIWHVVGMPAAAWMLRHSEVIGWSMAGFAFLLLPVFVGARHGRRAPEQAGLGIAVALAAEMVIASLLYGTVALNSNDGASTGITNMLFNFLLALLAVWIPVAGGAAAISSWRTRRSKARRIMA